MVGIVGASYRGLRKQFKIHRLMTLVTNGKVTEGVALFLNLHLIEQTLIKENIAYALKDCADFLDPKQNYRGDDTTFSRLSVLMHSYAFAKDIGVSNADLDIRVASHNLFSQSKFLEALKAVQKDEKIVPITRLLNILDKIDLKPADISHQAIPT